MHNEQQYQGIHLPDCLPTGLPIDISIEHHNLKRIIKDESSVIEMNSVLPYVDRVLFLVPIKLQTAP